MRRVVILGIDGMDNDLLSKWQQHLPVFTALRDSMPDVKFRSIFPPDTTPAWASIYTGMTPAEHGIINFVNPADREEGYNPLELDDALLEGKTFWDAVSKAEYPVCVVFPMIVYPGWPVKGTILTRSTSPHSQSDPLSSFPDEVIDRYHPMPEKLNLVGGFFAKSKLRELSKLLRDRLKEEARICKAMLEGELWSLYFAYFSPLDEVQHVFWPYCDPEHPLYPGPNEFEGIILDFYMEMDKIVGELMAKCDPDDALIVISDHGHGARPSFLVNINEWLRRQGYLSEKKKGGAASKNKIKSYLKKVLLSYVHKFGANKYLLRLSKMFPVWKTLLASSSGIDWDLTKAYVSDLSAVKNYSYGGIRINEKAGVADADVNKLISEILKSFDELKLPDTNEPVVKWADRRENLYSGPYIDKYPEILIELDERYGIGWEYSGLLFKNEGDMYHLKPGSHRRSTAVFLSRNVDVSLLKEEMDLIDIAPLVKRMFSIKET